MTMSMVGCPSGSRGFALWFLGLQYRAHTIGASEGWCWRLKHLAIVRRHIVAAPLSAPRGLCLKARSGGHFTQEGRPTHAAGQSPQC